MLIYKGKLLKKIQKEGKDKHVGKTFYSFILNDGAELYPMNLSVKKETFDSFKENDEIECPVKAFARGENNSRAYISFTEDTD